MENEEIKTNNYQAGNSRKWTGILLLIIGGVLLAKQSGLPVPEWIFNWHFLLIALGLFIGIRHGFRGPGWLIMVAIGSFFFIDDYFPAINVTAYMWPIIIIGVGLLFIFRPKNYYRERKYQRRMQQRMRREERRNSRFSGTEKETITDDYTNDEDRIDIVSVFSNVKKNILSKNFKGGESTSLFGGAEINLSKADINGKVLIELNQIFGGTKLIVPPHWEIKYDEQVSVFGGIEDKRPLDNSIIDPDKVLILKGTSVFGGIDIRSY